jgi:hypothetical protein
MPYYTDTRKQMEKGETKNKQPTYTKSHYIPDRLQIFQSQFPLSCKIGCCIVFQY